MDALLIVSGLLLILVGWLWLAISSRRLPLGRLLMAVILPLLTLFMRNRGYAVLPRLVILFGLSALIAGTVILALEQPERFYALKSGSWVEPQSVPAELEGVLMGQRFAPNRVYWRGTDLLFEEGDATRVRRSLSINFADTPELLESLAIERLPGDDGPWPELLLQWYTGALQAPGLRRVGEDYTLSLAFLPQPDNRVRVRIHLHLPPTHGTLLSGELTMRSKPDWIEQLQTTRQQTPPVVPVVPDVEPTPAEREPVWREVSVLGLIDEPAPFIGETIRLTTWTGREYEGRLKAVTTDQRIVLAQPRGPNQVDFHFHPLDIRDLEMRYR